MRIPTVAILGRTNVGKSTLFNALIGRRRAVVQDEPGTTRDRNYQLVDRFGFKFTLVDTGGLVGEDLNPLREAVRAQAEVALGEADIVVGVFDGLHGLHPLDEEVVSLLRNSKRPVIWVANKCESPAAQVNASELYALGVEDIVPLTAAHRRGIRDLVSRLRIELEALKLLHEVEEPAEEDEFEFEEAEDDAPEISVKEKEDPNRAVRIAVVGKPNVGKSTLINKILGEDRLVTSPIAGTTRDEIDVTLVRDGRDYTFVDTAGLRRKARIDDETSERVSVMRAVSALRRSDVALLVLDAEQGMPTDQDAKIASLVHERGRALVILVNKWDAIEKDNYSTREYEEAIYKALPFVKYAPILFISAKTGQRVPDVFKKIRMVYEEARIRLKTAEVNRLLDTAFTRNPPPVHRGVPIKLFYASQVDVAPPSLALVVNYPKSLDATYQRYLKSSIRETHSFTGSDIRLFLKKRVRRGAETEKD